MKKQIVLAVLFLFTLNSFSQTTDYRDSFTGEFQGVLYISEFGYPDYSIIDTINTIIKVDKFQGYTIGNDSNYVDVEHKLSITFDTIHSEVYVYKCSGPVYILDGYIHPTVDGIGNLSYPELESCQDSPEYAQQNGYLQGFINNDSISVEFGYSDKWGGSSRKIIGKRVIDEVFDVQLPKLGLLLYPNPAEDFIVLKNSLELYDVTICSVEGKVMYSASNTSETKFSISSFPKGIYFLRVSDFNTSYTFKFIRK